MDSSLDNSVTVFANGIWKSGNNLLIKLFGLLGVPKAEFGVASSLIYGNNFLVRQIIRGSKFERNPYFVGLDASVSVSKIWLDYKVSSLKGTCIGGHAAYSDQLLRMLKSKDIKPVQIIRDPRDVVCSFSHWIMTRPDYYAYPMFKPLSFEERIMALIDGVDNHRCPLESFATVLDRAYGWLGQPKNVLVVRFEDLVGIDGGGDNSRQLHSINEIIRWSGFEDIDVEEVASNLFGGTKTFRKGKIQSWEDEFNSKINNKFSEKIGDRLKLWGYD